MAWPPAARIVNSSRTLLQNFDTALQHTMMPNFIPYYSAAKLSLARDSLYIWNRSPVIVAVGPKRCSLEQVYRQSPDWWKRLQHRKLRCHSGYQ